MKIWIFNNYSHLPDQGGLNRHYFFARQLQKMGHEPVVFTGSHPHNTSIQMIEGREAYRVGQAEPFPWVYVRTCNYEGSLLKRVWSMLQFYRNAKKAAAHFGRPDVILGSSPHPLDAVLAIRLGKKYACRSIAEVRDLWPESIVAYGVAGPHNPAVIALRGLEKWIYKKADSLIFTLEGAYDYIIEQGWEKSIPRSKVHYINNGVDLEAFRHNREHCRIDDPDLTNPDIFRVVYVGSVRQVNHLGGLLDAAKKVEDPRIRFLIWGDGDERPALEQRVRDEKIPNVKFKGRVDKKYIPYIVSCADLNLIHSGSEGDSLFRFGISFNKMFDCLAAGKPILMDIVASYNPVEQWKAGFCFKDAKDIPDAIERVRNANPESRRLMEQNACRAAENFDFRVLTEKLICVMEGKA